MAGGGRTGRSPLSGGEGERDSGASAHWRPRGSLLRSTVITVLVWSLASALLLSTFAYGIIWSRTEQRAVQTFAQQIEQRGQVESRVFQLAARNLATFRRQFLQLYLNPEAFADARFEDYFEEEESGAIRLRRRFYDGYRDDDGLLRRHTSGFIGRRRPILTDELQRRLILTYELVDRLGPAWIDPFANLHASLPENALINHWPGVPWGLRADPDLDMISGAVIGATLQARNPERRATWSGLYFDLTAQKWAITFQLPIDHDGRHLVNASHDILLDDLVGRLGKAAAPGANNLIIAANGDLVAQPGRMEQIREKQGVLNVASLGDEDLSAVYRLLSRARAQGRRAGVLESDALSSWIAFTRLDGPDWWYVTIYPRTIVSDQVRDTGLAALLLSLLGSLLVALVVLAVLRTRLAEPLQQLQRASDSISNGRYAAVAEGEERLPVERDDEVGLLARSFRSMAGKVRDASENLERSVAARTLELQLANRRLQELSVRDALTGALNRRAFDRDLATAVESARAMDRPFALFLADIDFFKRYNDSYGHPAGDQVLSLIFSTIAQTAPDRHVYRYGGEELAILLDPQETDCVAVAEQMIRRIAALRIPHRASPYGHVTMSGGLACTHEELFTIPALIAAADAELYRSKSAGRNRLSVSERAVSLCPSLRGAQVA